MSNATTAGSEIKSESHSLGAWLVFASAVSWSTGGIISRLADVDNPWNTVFWRSGSAMLLLLLFMLVRDGGRGTLALFRGMGIAGLAVGMCFAIASTSFIVALQFTTVANILLMQAGVPLIAALISRIVFGEPLRPSTWIAIGAVIFGVAVMVSDSFNGQVSPIGDGLALVISFAFALATVITRRYSHIRMTPAVTTGVGIAWVVSIFMSLATVGGVMVEAWQLPLLFVFGATLALGLALFTSGARRIPSAFAALIGTVEPILGPIWVWAFLNEIPSVRTIVGGSIVLTALIAYLVWQMVEQRRMKRLAPPVH